MRKTLSLILALVSSVLCAVGIQASILDKQYTLFSPQGLSSGTTYSVVKDHDGFLWVSTRNGIDRYDGLRFRHYRLNGNVRRGLHDGMMISLVQSQDGEIWAITERSITYRYNPVTDMFEEALLFPLEDGVGSLLSLYPCGDELLFGVSNGLMSYTYKDGAKRTVNLLQDRMVRCIKPYSKGCLALGTNKGLVLYDPSTRRSTAAYERVFADVNTLYYDEANQVILLGTNGQGLYVLNEQDGRTMRIGDDRLVILDICPVSSEEYLICTDGSGVFVARRDADGRYQMTLLASDSSEAIYAIHGSCVRSAMVDGDNIWLCMHYGGMVKMSPSSTVVEMKNPNVKAPSDGYAFGAAFDDQGRAWVAFNQVIGCFDQEKESQTFYLDHEARYLCVAPMPDGTVWCGGFNTGLYHFDPATGRKEFLSSVHGAQNNDCVYALHVDAQGCLWVGGLNFGLTRIRQSEPRTIGDDLYSTLDYDHFNVLNVTDIEQMTDSMIAVSTCDGLFLINTFTRRMEHLFLVKDDAEWQGTNYFCSVAPTNGHEVWLATDGAGLLFYDSQSRKMESFGYEEGLPSLELRGVSMLNDTTLCVTTEKDGVFSFNTRSHTFMHCLHSSGVLNGNQFQQNALCSDGKGHIVVCGDKEAFLIGADDLIPEYFDTQLHLDGQQIIDETITLPADRRDLSLSFTTTDIEHQDRYQFFYRILGLDSEWTWVDETRRIEYHHMPAGKYTLEVMAVASSEMVFTRSLNLVAEGNIWEQWYSPVILIVLLLVLVYVIHRFFSNKRQHNNA